MSAPGHTTSLRKETFENLQLNAGVFLKNFDYSSISDAAALKTAILSAITAGTNILGATRGGGSFVATRTLRTPDADGNRYGFVGDTFVDNVDAKLSATLIEMTAQNIKDAFGSATITTNGKKTTIRVKTAIGTEDYLTNLCWIGDLADGRLVMISLDNALNKADFNLTFTDKGEGTLPVEFHAHQNDVLDYDYAPFEIVYFEPDGTAAELTFTSAAGTNVGETAISTENSLSSGQHYVYKFDTTAPSIGYREEPDYTWTEWDGSSAINVGAANNGKKITIAVVNASKKVVKIGNATLAVKTA